MIISWYLQKNGEGDKVDDTDYVSTDVPKRDNTNNDTVGSNENDDVYVGIDEDEEDKDEDEDEDEDEDDGSHWCYYWDCGCFSLSPCY